MKSLFGGKGVTNNKGTSGKGYGPSGVTKVKNHYIAKGEFCQLCKPKDVVSGRLLRTRFQLISCLPTHFADFKTWDDLKPEACVFQLALHYATF